MPDARFDPYIRSFCPFGYVLALVIHSIGNSPRRIFTDFPYVFFLNGMGWHVQSLPDRAVS